MATKSIVLPVNSASEFNRGSTASLLSSPSNFAAEAGNTQNILNWDAVTNALRYHIYFDTSSGVTTADTRISVEGQTTYTHTGLTNGIPYYYKIATVGSGGESTLSSEISATPTDYGNVYSLSFDGSNEYCTFNAMDYAAITISFWIKPNTSSSGFPRPIFMPGYYVVYEPGNNRFQFRAQWTNLPIWQAPTSSLSKNVWSHVAISYDAASTANDPVIYVNGLELSITETTAPSGTRASNSGASAIAATTVPDNYFFGHLDEIAIYNSALPLADITDIYNSGDPPNLSSLDSSSSLVHWYRMGDNDTFPTIQDTIGTRDLTMVNMEAGDIVAEVP